MGICSLPICSNGVGSSKQINDPTGFGNSYQQLYKYSTFFLLSSLVPLHHLSVLTFCFFIFDFIKLQVERVNNSAKNINDCPVQTINNNRTCGQSFMFFVQAKAARTDFKVLQACGGCGRLFRLFNYQIKEIKKLLTCLFAVLFKYFSYFRFIVGFLLPVKLHHNTFGYLLKHKK